MYIAIAFLIFAISLALFLPKRTTKSKTALSAASQQSTHSLQGAKDGMINRMDYGTKPESQSSQDEDDLTPTGSPIKQQVPQILTSEMEQPLGKQSGTKTPTAGLMPPPRAPASSLRIPSTGPLPNRGPPKQSLAAPAANTAGQRNKVVLEPGHSPLDWATLSRTNNLSGVPGLQRITPSMLAFHHGRKGRDAWSSFRGKVYNITPYLPFHPGGKGELMRAAGKDGEKLFMEIHSWVNWENMMSSCVVGIMVAEEVGKGLDELD